MGRGKSVSETADMYIMANYNKKTKKEIAEYLEIPIGTVISRHQCITHGKRRWKIEPQKRVQPGLQKLRFLGEK